MSRGNKLSPTDIAKVALVGPQLEHFYKIGISDNEILYRLGSAYTYSDLSQLTELIWDLKPERARALFYSGIIDFNDFS